MGVDDKKEGGKEPIGVAEPAAEPSANAQAADAMLRIQMPLKKVIADGVYDWEALAEGVRAARKVGCATDDDVIAVEAKGLDIDRLKEIRDCLAQKAGAGRPAPKRPREGDIM